MINTYLEILRDKKGSDLFLSANCKPLIKIEGNLHEIGEEVLSADSVKSAALGIMSEIQVKKFEEELESHLQELRAEAFVEIKEFD